MTTTEHIDHGPDTWGPRRTGCPRCIEDTAANYRRQWATDLANPILVLRPVRINGITVCPLVTLCLLADAAHRFTYGLGAQVLRMLSRGTETATATELVAASETLRALERHPWFLDVDRGTARAVREIWEAAAPAESDEAFETIRYTADVIATTPDGRVLLIERGWAPYEGCWALPGGHVDAGETGLAAAVRELAEETGVRVDPSGLRQVGVFDDPGRDPRGRYVTVAYHAVVPAHTLAVAGDDARTAHWWSLNDLPEALAFDHAAILAALCP